MNSDQPLIEVRDLWKIYGKGETSIEALKGVSLEVARNEIVAIMGPSGCGKTTLLNCLSGLDDINKGTVTIGGHDQFALKAKQRDEFRVKHMGFVFQSYNLIPVLTAAENVEIPLLCQGVKPKEARSEALEALTRVGLRDRAGHRPSELSGGQQQRVAIARAIVNRPHIIWMDEPTGALDSKTNLLVMDLIEYLNRSEGITFVIVTHNPDVAQYADRTLFMDSGKVVSVRGNNSRRSAGVAGGWESC